MADDQPTKIEVNGREILFPPIDPNIGEMADAENYFGVEWDKPERSGARLIAALLWIAIRRVDPTVTVDDVRSLDPEILNQLQGDARPPDQQTSDVSKPDSNGTSSEDSSSDSEGSAPIPTPTGLLGSDTGSTFAPTT